MERLTQQERDDFSNANPDWDLEGETISRTFEFESFIDAIGFVNKVAIAAEVADHHPDIDVRWKKVKLALSTHEADGLTSRDIDLAAKADALGG
jgi:4a-hydroxytetrahydrobiopterin dehydratase